MAAEAARWLADHGDALHAYALRRTRSASTAEDLVQDTLLAAMRSGAEFQGRSDVRTWLVGILRHKLLDHWRRRGRGEAAIEALLAAVTTSSFDTQGKWARPPGNLPDGKELLEALRACVERLPPRASEAILLREAHGVGLDVVAGQLGTSSGATAQLLFRTRAALRECVEGAIIR